MNLKLLGNPKQNKRSFSLVLAQVGAVIVKKCLLAMHRYPVVVAQIIVPSLIVALFVVFMKSTLPALQLPALPMTLKPYLDRHPVVIISDNTQRSDSSERDILYHYKKLVNATGGAEIMEVMDVNKFIEGLPVNSMLGFNKHHIFGIRVEAGTLYALFNNEYYHTMPLSLNYLYNAYAKSLNCGFEIEIAVTNFPLPLSSVSKFDLLATGMNMGFQLVSAMGFAIAFMSSFYIVMSVRERVTRFKLLQLVSGVDLWTYWLTTFLHDYVTFSFVVLTMLGTLCLYDEDGFNSAPEIFRMGLMYLFYIWAVLPWIYNLSMFFETGTGGFVFVFQLAIWGGNSLHYIVLALRNPSMDMPEKAELLKRVFWICPFFTIVNGLNNLNNLNQYGPVSEEWTRGIINCC